MAELANFPEDVVNLARRKAEELEDFSQPSNISDGSEKEVCYRKKFSLTACNFDCMNLHVS